ncbi:hypothetical protein RO3G_01712 [Rhizopus delemar RA 99-880]|nr:hypothetical protein RO3G_01712 [Rhizopus delemar RA 99-880]|eukprot:EIE77008.1 hypothetical protein RO3G_01712 [Rhizopus delemar RA 99-880]
MADFWDDLLEQCRNQYEFNQEFANHYQDQFMKNFKSRSMMRKLREQDSWCKNEKMFEDEHHIGGGFCKDADYKF